MNITECLQILDKLITDRSSDVAGMRNLIASIRDQQAAAEADKIQVALAHAKDLAALRETHLKEQAQAALPKPAPKKKIPRGGTKSQK
jgi:hypothetical protein